MTDDHDVWSCHYTTTVQAAVAGFQETYTDATLHAGKQRRLRMSGMLGTRSDRYPLLQGEPKQGGIANYTLHYRRTQPVVGTTPFLAIA